MASQNLLPPVLEVEFGDELQSFAADDQKFSQRFITRTKAGIASILKDLGIPGEPAVEIRSVSSADSFRAYLNGNQIRYSRETFRSIWEYLSCSSIGELPIDYYWDRWLADNVTSERIATDTQRSELIAEFLASLVVESAKQYPERLFAHEQAVAYLGTTRLLGLKVEGLNEPARLLSILKPVLRLRISIADTAAVVNGISDGISMGCSDEDIAENLIARLRPRLLEIRCNPNYLSQWIR
ncbi:MAG: hypothetical protein L0220_11035, partial [Acidobacteria bacterium]|nr:hypothetical protein [Acidobacteriota bacterium]